MKCIKFLLTCLLSINLIIYGHSQSGKQSCDKVEAEVQFTDKNPANLSSVRITLLRGDRSSVRYIFCNAKDGKVLNEGKFDENEITGLLVGKYFCIVSTNDCSKRIDFNIE